MRRLVSCLFGLLIAALVVAGPLWYSSYRTARIRSLYVVREGVLYRSGQMTLEGLQQVIRDYQIRTIVSLRDSRRHPDEPPPDTAEEIWCRDNHVSYFRLPPLAWSAEDGSVPADAPVQRFCDVMRNAANYPVLIHCYAGKHRTGAFCAVYRMEIEHWSNEAAVAEMVQLGYDLLDEHEDVRRYLQQYRPSWQRARSAHAAGRTASEEAAEDR
jgi:tyrosine-protein phosphatase SIW14